MGSQRKTRSGLGATRNGQGQRWAGKGMGETELGEGFQETLDDGASVDNLTAVGMIPGYMELWCIRRQPHSCGKKKFSRGWQGKTKKSKVWRSYNEMLSISKKE